MQYKPTNTLIAGPTIFKAGADWVRVSRVAETLPLFHKERKGICRFTLYVVGLFGRNIAGQWSPIVVFSVPLQPPAKSEASVSETKLLNPFSFSGNPSSSVRRCKLAFSVLRRRVSCS
ncbi:hypothetical protein MA16_Dca023181 [Dendrobium catenatum]|uniref:Uncharacterized protein n=1 Tax=Dendrobium catenatum TaxID=906689 RepID=A0A2I0VE76_9ASPA|nr:hypothetical protein MA16_Dca023181 [Dendrobium catenatum]